MRGQYFASAVIQPRCGERTGHLLRNQQKAKSRLGGSDEPGSWRQGNTAVFGKKKVIIHVAFAAEPKVFYLNFCSNPAGGAYHSAVAEIVELFVAFRI
jgi:hypothetical protein